MLSALVFCRRWARGLCVLAFVFAPGAQAQPHTPAPFAPSALDHENPRYHRAIIRPTLVHLKPGEEKQFKAIMLPTRLMAAEAAEDITWAVNDIPGGNETLGTIDETGRYRAPASTPSPRELYICAEVPGAANRSLVATVIIGPEPIRYKSVHVWAESRDDPDARLRGPHGIGLDRDGNILIADQGASQVLRYSQQGEFLDQIDNGRGRDPGQVQEPREVKSDANGRIFVTDSKGDRPRVQVFSHEGEFLQIFAEKGRLQGMLLRAHGHDFDHHGRLFIVDVDNMRVSVYDEEGNSLYDFGTEGILTGEMNAPHGLFVDRSGDVFVSGYYGPTQKFTPDGDFLFDFAHGDPPDGPVYFHSIAGDKWGNAYLSVRGQAGYDGDLAGGERVSVMKFNNHGDFITSWAFSAEEHTESAVGVDDDGRVHALFKGAVATGVETFAQE